MALPLTLRYRPRKWSDLVGQDVPVTTLTKMIRQNQLPQSIILAGSRGLGKTTIARIIARVLNCPNVEKDTTEPCGTCDICKEITLERSMAVQEMDAASHGNVDDIRRIKEECRFMTNAKAKVYVVDEAHSLSKAAWEAFLKLLEEPPPNVYFVFCTTEVNRVPVTIVSRSLNLPFNRVSVDNIVGRLQHIANLEKITVEPAAFIEIAKHSDGGMRDSISKLDQLSSFAEGIITKDHVLRLVGSVNTSILFDLVRALTQSDLPAVFRMLAEAYVQISDVTTFIGDLSSFYRDLMMVKTGLPPQDTTPEYMASIKVLAGSLSLEYLIESQGKLYNLVDHIRRSPLPARQLLEVHITELLYSGLQSTAAKSNGHPPQPVQAREQVVFVNPDQLAAALGGVVLQM